MPEFDYRLVYTDHGSYLALQETPKTEVGTAFWQDFRNGVAAAIALPLTVFTYLF